MAVSVLVDGPAVALQDALNAIRETPAPLGQVPARLTLLAHAVRELQGVYLRELAAVDPAAEGVRSVADLLVDAAGLPVTAARADAALAVRLAPLPGLLDALAGGAVELPAARLLARAWSVLPSRLRDAPTAEALLTLGMLVDLADLRAKVDELCAALQPDVTDEALAAAQESGELVLTDVGAETRLSGHTDRLQGEWLREVLSARAEADRGLADGRTSGARLLDALLDIVREHVPAPDGSDRALPTLVVVAAAADLFEPRAATPDQALAAMLGTTPCGTPPPVVGARTRGGCPVGHTTLRRLCCESALTRLLLDPLGWPLDSSPRARQLSRRERRALEHRAGYRCQREGCGRPAAVCVPHHVVPFALGGPSTQANTVLLCRSCHHLLHDRGRVLGLVDGARIGPQGWVRPPPGAPPEPVF